MITILILIISGVWRFVSKSQPNGYEDPRGQPSSGVTETQVGGFCTFDHKTIFQSISLHRCDKKSSQYLDGRYTGCLKIVGLVEKWLWKILMLIVRNPGAIFDTYS